MLRPDMWIDYAKRRSELKLSDFHQLMDGVNVGGRIIVGGSEQVCAQLMSVLRQNRRLGVVEAMSQVKTPALDPHITYGLDIMAVAQLVMIAKNEAFHGTIDQAINLLQQLCVEEQQAVETGLQVLREKADEIGHL